MSYIAGRTVAACMLPMFGFILAVMGFVFSFFDLPGDDIFSLVSQIMLYGGILMIVLGIALVPSARTETNKRKSVIEIVAVRKQVTISEISQETGLDREYIRQLLTNLLIAHALFGYIEDDLFVRDTSGRPRFSGGQMGLFGANS